MHTYRTSVQQQSIDLPTDPTNKSKCSADKPVETTECEMDLYVDIEMESIDKDTVGIGTEAIYESIPDLQQSFNTSPPPCSLLEKSERYEAMDTADTVSNQMGNTYYIELIPGQ